MSPNMYHTLVFTFTNVHPEYCNLNLLAPPAEATVTPDAPKICVCPAPNCITSILVPIGKATEEFNGTVKVFAVANDIRKSTTNSK